MEPSTDIPDTLLDNDSSFVHPFFSGLELRPAPDPLVVRGKARNYLFPTLYADVRCAQGIFHCSWKAARDLLAESLGPHVLPPRMLGGRSIVAVSCYEYRSVRGVRPYNEVAIALPLRLDGKTGAPVLGAFAGGPSAGYYIASMPVTSEENRLRGHHYWNLPKITRRIDCLEEGGVVRFSSYAEDGMTADISLSVPAAGKMTHLSVKSFLATKKDGKPLRSPTAFDGDFAVNLRPGSLFGLASGGEALVLGSGEAAEVLRRLRAETRPLQTRYSASMNSWFDLPLEGAQGATR
jgi:hypothetical protein